MNALDRALDSISLIIKSVEEDEDILNSVPNDMPGAESLQAFIDEYEKKLAKLLRKQMKYYVDAINKYGAAEDVVTEDLLTYLDDELFVNDDFESDMASLSEEMLFAIILVLCEIAMEAIDPDIPFEELSGTAATAVRSWAIQLASFLFLTTRNGIISAITTAITGNLTLSALTTAIQDLGVFGRNRAASLAENEVLTALSISQQESYAQSPAVTGKVWVHTDRQEGEPRANHQKMDGVEKGVFEEFEIIDSDETCMYPREPKLSPTERMHCNCVIFPVVNGETLKLSKEVKAALREEYLAERRLKS
ncbi:phage minor head protein [Bacillus thuringiensis]|uniref:phage minor head protein n=1 Tax=Bacillus thuringiensis TaxID=1428 RepID=UPI002AB36F0E|nr:phage minor head protein [Bacillus thuringiensis]MDY7964981.1 phage minor head protein [Bacillus thuringiensis]